MSENDELDKRKENVWSMNEVRSGGSDRSDTARISDSSETEDTTDREDPGDARNTSNTATGDTIRKMYKDSEEKSLAVRDLHNVNVYLYEDVYREMMTAFKDLDSEYFTEHGEELSKNKEFFNAVFRAGLQSPRIREELELDDK